jgi:hypothetical protein
VLVELRALEGVHTLDIGPGPDGHERITLGTENGTPTLPRLLDVLVGGGAHVRALEELDGAEVPTAAPMERS